MGITPFPREKIARLLLKLCHTCLGWTIGRNLRCLLAVALAVRVLTAWPLQQPGYMDAAYYLVGGQRLYQGYGFSEPFLWNYLDNPRGIPHPSHLYWMPLASVLVYLSFLVFGPSYRAAQVPFIVLSALVPPLTAWLSWQMTRNHRHAWVAGLLALFSGFYMAYWVSPDNTAPFALTTALALVALARGLKTGRWPWYALSGALAGLSHLARADGLLLLGAIYIILVIAAMRHSPSAIRPFAIPFLLPAVSYLLIMSPWFLHNLRTIGTPLSPAGTKTIFLTDYDDLFSYGKPLTLQTYLAWGWGNILRSKLEAAWLNFQTLWAVVGMIFVGPLGAWGLWRVKSANRKSANQQIIGQHPPTLPPFHLSILPTLQPPPPPASQLSSLPGIAAVYGALLYGVMTLVFTFPGVRGGMLHSGAALVPFLCAAAPAGLDAAVDWMARQRPHWQPEVAKKVFSGGLVFLAMLMSGLLYWRAVFSGGPLSEPWNERDRVYSQVADWLDEHGVPPQERVLVNNPPAFYLDSGREGLVIPNGDVETLLQVSRRYGAGYLVLGPDCPRPLHDLYTGAAQEPRLTRLAVFATRRGAVYLYRVEEH